LIYSLFGYLKLVKSDFFVIQCCGVGYKCKSDKKTLFEFENLIDSQIEIFTHMNVKENVLDLFGFKKVDSLEFFRTLIGITGIGPKAALSILSEFSPSEAASIIDSGESLYLTKASGIGEKTAKRIILELKNKLRPLEIFRYDNRKEEISRVLSSLGYSAREIVPILDKLDASMSVEESIKEALKLIGG